MRRFPIVAALAVLGTVLGATASSGARTANVDVLDTRIRPAAVAVDLGGTVTWTNKGKKPHVVVSLAATFRPLVLRPGQSKRVVFKKRACERYSVDNRFRGSVAVGGASCGSGGRGGGSGGGGGDTGTGLEEKIVRYDVTVTAYLHLVESRTSPSPNATGTTDLELSWTGTWRRQDVKIQTGFGYAGFMTVPRSQTRGMIRGHLEWSETRPISGGPCAGEIDYAGKAKATLQGSRPKGSKPGVNFDAYVINASAIDKLTQSRQAAACKGSFAGLPHWTDETRLIVQGVDIHHPPGFSIHPMDTRWSREGAVGTMPFPFDRVLAHRGFTLNSGTRRASRSETGFSERFTGRVKYVFAPVR